MSSTLFVSLPVSQCDAFWPGLLLLGFFIGIITGLFGVGGGFLLTPALRVVFHISYPVAIGSSLLQIMITSMFSVFKHWKQDHVDLKLGAITAVGCIIGTECGVRALRFVNTAGAWNVAGHSTPVLDIVIDGSFIVLMSIVAVSIYREACASSQSGRDEPKTALGEKIRSCPLPPFVSLPKSDISRLSVWMPMAFSLFVGCLTGFLGIGGGFISLPILIYLLGVPTRTAVGTSTLQVLIASGYGMIRHLQDGHVDVVLVLFMVIGSMLGVSIGVKLSGLVNACNTRKYFAGLLLVAILLIVFDLIRSFIA
jgi:Predicted permeases